MTLRSSMSRNVWIPAVLSAALVVALIWYPFGFSLGGLIEEWDYLYVIGTNPGFWNSFPGNPMSDAFAARPLQITPFWLAHLISAHSFLGFHLILIVACFLRVFSGIVIGRFLFKRPFYAILLGLLAFVFPAETQQFAFRTLGINLSLALALGGSAALLVAIDDSYPTRRRWMVVLSVAASVCATLIYEPSITLYAIPPLALFARDGLRGMLRIMAARLDELFLWLLGPILNAAYFIYAVYYLKSSYETSSASHGMLGGVWHNFHYLVDSLALRIFVDGWRSAFAILPEVTGWPYFVFAAVLLVAGFWALCRCGDELRRDWWFACRLIVAGVLIGIFAYMPFMVAESHMPITQRTMMAPQFGGALVFVAILFVLLGRYRIPLALASAVLVLLGFVAQVYQMDSYTRAYVSVVRPYISMIADRADTTKTVHLVIDRTGYGGYLDGLYETVAGNGPRVRLNKFDQNFFLCMDDPATVYLPHMECRHEGGQWKITPAQGAAFIVPDGNVDALEFGPDFDSGYRSQGGFWHDLGSFTPAQSLFRQQLDHDDWFECEPSSMWGYSHDCRGTGWSDVSNGRTKLDVVNYIFAISPKASFLFGMKPDAGGYVLRIKIVTPSNPEIAKGLKLFVNGHQIGFDMQGEALLEAKVPSSDLVDGTNSITLENAMISGQSMGLPVSGVSLMPAGRVAAN